MDGQRFDTLLKSVSGRRSRRQMLRGLLGGALSVGAFGALTTRPAEAAPRWCGCHYACPIGSDFFRCEKNSNGTCPNARSQGGETCFSHGLTGCFDSRKACNNTEEL